MRNNFFIFFIKWLLFQNIMKLVYTNANVILTKLFHQPILSSSSSLPLTSFERISCISRSSSLRISSYSLFISSPKSEQNTSLLLHKVSSTVPAIGSACNSSSIFDNYHPELPSLHLAELLQSLNIFSFHHRNRTIFPLPLHPDLDPQKSSPTQYFHLLSYMMEKNTNLSRTSETISCNWSHYLLQSIFLFLPLLTSSLHEFFLEA
ncbi:MAG: hypothetical protein Ta2E_09380 [Mycoplasmoidaceae bacterium]|nr:MAG: hypothetical protein Ta2E_09380 [Mycoplasmoidaceae bacterium]